MFLLAKRLFIPLEKKVGLSGIVLKVNLEKAYDRIDWDFLNRPLLTSISLTLG